MEAHVTYTFDEQEFLRQFDYLQSDNVDILARAMELSSIPSDSNNNDLLREDIQKKKTADLVKIASFTLPPSPPT